MVKKAVQHGPSKRRGEGVLCFGTLKPPSAARTKLADFFNILLDGIHLKRGFRARGG